MSRAPPDPTALPGPFDAHLVNGPFGDPALFVDLVHGRRAFLVGPPGMVERVEHKLRAYTWNLLEGYVNELAFEVTEIGERGPAARAAFRLRAGFAREPLAPAAGGPTVVEDPNLRVTAATLDDGTPCLAYAIEERVHVNVWKSRLAEHGLGTGPWLAELKALAVAGAPDDTPVHARWREGGGLRAERFALGWLKERLLHIVRGRKLAYVTDAAWTPGYIGRIVELARDAEVLFIEAPFLDRDRERAAARRHLTARQAGVLACRAGVRRVVPFHFSPRHAHEEVALRGEVEAAFAGREGIRAMRMPRSS